MDNLVIDGMVCSSAKIHIGTNILKLPVSPIFSLVYTVFQRLEKMYLKILTRFVRSIECKKKK